jgi:hypothetical protein
MTIRLKEINNMLKKIIMNRQILLGGVVVIPFASGCLLDNCPLWFNSIRVYIPDFATVAIWKRIWHESDIILLLGRYLRCGYLLFAVV